MPVVYSNHYSQNPDFYEEMFRDTDYYDSYLGIMEQYQNEPTGTFFGTLTGKNAQRRYEHYQNRDAALNALLEQMRTDQYNSSASKVARDREAGLNPDLLGASGGAESSPISSLGQPLTPDDSFQHVTNFISMVASAAVSVQSMVQQQLVNEGMRIQNARGLIENESLSLDNFIRGNEIAFASLLRDDPKRHPANGDELSDSDSAITPSYSLHFNTGNKSLDKRLSQYATNWNDSFQLELARLQQEKERVGLRKDTHDLKSSPGYTEDDNFYGQLAVKLADVYNQMRDMQIELSKKQITEETQYLDSFDSALSGESANSDNERSKSVNELFTRLFSLEEGVLGYIKDEAMKGRHDAIQMLFTIFGMSTHQSVLYPFKELGMELEASLPWKMK